MPLRLHLTAALLFATAPLALAQTAPDGKPLAFDVVSIKPNHTGSPAIVNHTPPDGYSFQNYPVRMLVSQAFGIRLDLISGGPAWVDSDRFDVVAKVAGEDLAAWKALSKDQRNQMLQAVLADRLHLVTHTAIKQMPGYTVTIAKGGPKLVEAKPGAGGWGAGRGSIRSDGMTMENLCDILSNINRQTVLDQTGLTGKYAVDLKWADLDSPVRPATANSDTAPEPSSLPALPTALEETLGLKLTATRLPTTTLVIDSAQKPSDN